MDASNEKSVSQLSASPSTASASMSTASSSARSQSGGTAPAQTICPRCHGVRRVCCPSSARPPNEFWRWRETVDAPPVDRQLAKQQLKELRKVGRRYAGVCTRRDVDTRLVANDFFVYHLARGAERDACRLPLMVAYKTSRGENKHYPVRSVNERAGRRGGNRDTYFYVEMGPDKPPMFASLHALIRYYETYNYMTPGKSVDTFPWWRLDGDSTRRPPDH